MQALFRLKRSIGAGAAIVVASFMTLGCAAPATAKMDAQEPVESQTDNQRPTADQIISALDAHQPMSILTVVREYWQRGDKLQAAFWYYVWQIRMDAWAQADSAYATFSTVMTVDTHDTIKFWIAADPVVWRDTMERASSYEAKLPLAPLRPDNVNAAEWDTIIAKTRAEYAAGIVEAFDNTTPEQMMAARSAAGFPVGPLTDMGTPLPDAWR